VKRDDLQLDRYRSMVRPMTAEEGSGYLIEFPEVPLCPAASSGCACRPPAPLSEVGGFGSPTPSGRAHKPEPRRCRGERRHAGRGGLKYRPPNQPAILLAGGR